MPLSRFPVFSSGSAQGLATARVKPDRKAEPPDEAKRGCRQTRSAKAAVTTAAPVAGSIDADVSRLRRHWRGQLAVAENAENVREE